MKKLFIYYSFSGNTDFVADFLKNKGISTIKIETLEKMPKNRILSILVGGFKAGIGYKDKIKDFNTNIDKYDEIIIGSPIWNGRLSSPINTVLDRLDLNNKKVSFIFCSGSGNSDKLDAYVKLKYNAKSINLKEPLHNKKELDKVEL
jgi:Multimeric flavodoxin WrbA